MIKRLIIFTASILTFSLLQAQTVPQGISYQAVARDAGGEILANADLNVQIGILMDAELRYEEIHAVTTNGFGLFFLIVGQGVNTGEGSLSTFEDNTWGAADHFLDIAIDSGDGVFESIGTTQLLSVPYAFHSATSDIATFALTTGNVDDADADPTNEKITLFEITDGTISITEAGEVFNIDLPEAEDDADADPTNEMITNMEYADNTLSITEGGIVYSTTIDDQVEDADADPTNESLTLMEVSGNTLTIIESGTEYTATLPDEVDDADADPSNEIISNFQISENTITLTEAGVDFSIDLPEQEPDLDWSIGEDVVYNITDDIGIGTSSPNSSLEVDGSMAHNVKYIAIDADDTFSMTENDHTLIVELLDASIDITLPNPGTCMGREYYIKAISASASPSCTISAEGSTIDNNAQITLSAISYESVHLISAGINGWFILD